MKSEAQIRATKKYDSKAYYKPTILIKREYQDLITARAKEVNKSVSSYVMDLIKQDLNIKED